MSKLSQTMKMVSGSTTYQVPFFTTTGEAGIYGTYGQANVGGTTCYYGLGTGAAVATGSGIKTPLKVVKSGTTYYMLTMATYTLTLAGTSNQTITLKYTEPGGSQQTKTSTGSNQAFTVKYGTSWQASVAANTNYTAGSLSASSGTVTGNTTVSASAAVGVKHDVYVYLGKKYKGASAWQTYCAPATLYVNNTAQSGTAYTVEGSQGGNDITRHYTKYSVPYNTTVKFQTNSTYSNYNTKVIEGAATLYSDGVTYTAYTARPVSFTMGLKELTIQDYSGLVEVAFKTNDSNPYVKVTYTHVDNTTFTTNRLNNNTTVTSHIKYNTTIAVKNDNDPYQILVYQGGTYKASINKNGTWTSGAITSTTTFEFRAYDPDCNCDCGDDS